MIRFVVMCALWCLPLCSKAQKDSINVYVFLSETCPICQNQTISLKDLYKQFHENGIRFMGVFPNTSLSNAESVAAFKKKYKLDFEVMLDQNQQLTQSLGASVTPQVFVTHNARNETLYQGKIDNSFERVGRRRQVITEFYLKNALMQILNNQIINEKKTEPVGCFIIKN